MVSAPYHLYDCGITDRQYEGSVLSGLQIERPPNSKRPQLIHRVHTACKFQPEWAISRCAAVVTPTIKATSARAYPAGVESGDSQGFVDERVSRHRFSFFREAGMPRPYSNDLRERAIEAVEAGASRREVADGLEVSPSSVINWTRRWHEEGSAAAKPSGGSVSPLEKCAS
jgi:hypothetical protein